VALEQTGELISVNVARVISTPPPVDNWVNRKPPTTGIDKRPVDGPVMVRRLGLDGDSICDLRNHGGGDQAAYAYAEQDADWWRVELAGQQRVPIGPGAFGENLTTRGLDLNGAVIGERWRVGGAILQVSVPRVPCSTLAAYWGVPRLVRRFALAARPGAYLRVLTEGEVRAGDRIDVLDRPAHGLTIQETFWALLGERGLAEKLLSADELPPDVHKLARRWLAIRR